MYEVVGFLLVLVVATVAVHVVASRVHPELRSVLWLSFLLRVVGAVVRYLVLIGPYRGVGDATGYFQFGAAHAGTIWAVDFEGASLSSGSEGTRFVRVVSAMVISIIGPTMLGEFLVFALASLLGLWLMISAASRQATLLDTKRYALVVTLAPSLWYWPCSIGKEALVLLALGLVVFGYVGARGRVAWIPLVAGLAFCALIRPHIAAIMSVGLVCAEILSGEGSLLSGKRLLKMSVIGVAATVLLSEMAETYGFDATDFEEVQAFMDYASAQTMQGGSQIEATTGPTRFAVGLVNVLFRPFPWEAHNVFAIMASAELVLLWGYVVRTRGKLGENLRRLPQDRALRFALPCGLLFALILGATFFNLGILARQRVAPFAVLLMCFWRTPQLQRTTPGPERYDRS